jgi:hypothetical protein
MAKIEFVCVWINKIIGEKYDISCINLVYRDVKFSRQITIYTQESSKRAINIIIESRNIKNVFAVITDEKFVI